MNTSPQTALMKSLLGYPKRSRFWRSARSLLLASLLLNTVGSSLAQPANDNFADRILISSSFVNVTGDNLNATLEPGEPTKGDKSVWWSWTAPASGVYTLTAVGLPGYFDPFLGVYTGSALSDLTLVASDTFNGSDNTYAARVVLTAAGGTTYALAVATVGGIGGGLSLSIAPTVPPTVNVTSPTNSATFYVGDPVNLSVDASDGDGTVTNVAFYLDFQPIASFTHPPYQFTLTFTNGPEYHRLQAQATDNWGVTTVSSEVQFLVTYPPPGNDDFANRFTLAGAPVGVTSDNEYATLEPGEPTEGDKSVWWSWTAPASGVYTLTAVGLPGYFYPFLGVYTGSALSDLTLVASDTFNGLDNTYAAHVVLTATGGTTYALAVATVGGIGGGLSLSIAPAVSPTPAPLVAMQKVLSDLMTLRATASAKHERKGLDDAIEELAEALDASLWVDDKHLRPKHGEKVFEETRNVIQELRELVRGKTGTIAEAALQDLITRLLSSGRFLAQIAITDAMAGSGRPHEMRDANRELAKGEQDIAKGDYERALEHYRHAWQEAIEAVR